MPFFEHLLPILDGGSLLPVANSLFVEAKEYTLSKHLGCRNPIRLPFAENGHRRLFVGR
jgi:hypothetical protein